MNDAKTFFARVRNDVFEGSLLNKEVDGMTRILNEWTRRGLTDVRWLAYMLATTYHETARTMQPIREMGGETYLKKKKYYPWVGEGLVQVTWATNHKKFGATAPGQLLTWPLCLKPLFDGMINGMFTGKKLADYFTNSKSDPIGARKIINGVDKAQLIAGYYSKFLGALTASETATTVPTPIPAPVAPLPAQKPPVANPVEAAAAPIVLPKPYFWAWLVSLFTKKG